MSIHSYDHPALAADVVLLAVGNGKLSLLLIQRAQAPFKGAWAFPGGFVELGEAPRAAALRELEEETDVGDVVLHQLGTFGDPERDPRGHVVSVTYVGVIASHTLPAIRASSDAEEARWWRIDQLPALAFDHEQILTRALRRFRAQISCVANDGQLACPLPGSLTIADLQATCRAIVRRLETSDVLSSEAHAEDCIQRSAAE